ncbi:hypothetical protein ACEPAG_6687 [Sanghuangporus baumii]
MPSTNSGEFCFYPKALAILEQCVRKLMNDGGCIERDPAKLWYVYQSQQWSRVILGKHTNARGRDTGIEKSQQEYGSIEEVPGYVHRGSL